MENRQVFPTLFFSKMVKKWKNAAKKLKTVSPHLTISLFSPEGVYIIMAEQSEIKQLKLENKQLSEKLERVLLDIDTVKAMNTMCDILEHRKQAVREFAEKIKTQVYPFLQAKLFNEKCYLTGNPESDIYREQKNQNIGILKAQDVLSQWFNIKIDELLKEYNLL